MNNQGISKFNLTGCQICQAAKWQTSYFIKLAQWAEILYERYFP